ncbi:MAG TPA: class I SAM-dependent methyltransferase [Acidimicrobiia bacterium]|nr:class I SAM-dependent methyltransferase [Acidimicrobiia bacterium]
MSGASDPIFAKIARRYDRINSVLSLGREQAWRREAVKYLPPGRLLDLGSGTGAAQEVFGERQVVALDPVVEMLRLSPIPHRVAAVGEHLPFENDGFDGVFSAFVIRNLTSVSDTLGEIHRVLRPGGKAVVVDLTRPASPFWKRVHRAGTAVVLPLVGAIFAGAPGEYRYLHRSLDSLPPPEELFAGGPLKVERVWRMGMNGFVYGAVLGK